MEAGLLPDPQLSAGMDHPTGGGSGLMNAYNLGINADLRALITRGAARDSARARARQVNLEVLWKEWQVAEKARQLFVEARAQDQLHAVYTSARDLYRKRYRDDKRRSSAVTSRSGSPPATFQAWRMPARACANWSVNRTRHVMTSTPCWGSNPMCGWNSPGRRTSRVLPAPT